MPTHFRRFLLLLLGLVLCGFSPEGTPRLQAQDAQPMTPKKGKPYRIANTDRIRIIVVQEDDLTSIVRVDAKGCVNLKYVGEVSVVGMLVSEAEKAIEKAYRDGRYLRNPQVTINVEEYAPRQVSISGEVRSAGIYPLPVETVMTVADLVMKAGGFSDMAKGSEVKVTRFSPDGRTVARVIVVNVESIIKGKAKNKDLTEDNSLELEPGDIVYVPQRII